jgi:hypothetical protein
MLRFVEDQLQEAQIPEIWETEKEEKLSDYDLRRLCFDFARQHFQGKSFKNRSIGESITVSRDGLGEWRTKTKSREQLISIKILDALLINCIYWYDREDTEKNPNVDKYAYFRQQCRVNGKNYTAIITIKIYKADSYHKYYHHYLDDVVVDPTA